MPSCHGSAPKSLGPCDATVALAGNPNVGKSSLFNALTGARALVANYPGKTVELEWGVIESGRRRIGVVDLPGAYSLEGLTEDQRIAAEVIRNNEVDAVLVVLDASNLARNLYLGLEVLATGLPTAFALNLVDQADARGKPVDVAALSRELGAPVVRTAGHRGDGAREALAATLAAMEAPRSPGSGSRTEPEDLHRRAREIAANVTGSTAIGATESALWRWTTTPSTGVALLLAVLLGIFSFVYFVGGFLSTAFSSGWSAAVSPVLQAASYGALGNGPAARVLLWGIDSGINATLAVGIPYVIPFYLLLGFLEDSGYMNAAAVLTHRIMTKLGLHGRATIPLISGLGCNVPAVIGTRVLSSGRERFIACTLISMVPCSARTAVVFGAVGLYLGPLPALAIFGITLLVTLGTGIALNRLVPGRPPPFLLELFPFRWPTPRNVAFKTWHRTKHFLLAAVPVVIVGSFLLGALYETGAMWALTGPLDPVVVGLLGLPPVAGLALVFGFLRKELALQLLVALAIMQYGGSAATLTSFLTPTQLFTYALVTALYVPCIASVAAIGRELGWRKALLISAITVVLALAAGALVAHVRAFW